MAWDRKVKWRQGILLNKDFFDKTPLLLNDDSYLMVISHDCDILNDRLPDEPNVEFIIVKFIDKLDGNFTNAKNFRKLHLSILINKKEMFLELIAKDKLQISKIDLSDLVLPEQVDSLSFSEKNILQDWLACRYRRQAFPENLGACIKPLEDYLKKISKKHAREITGYWIAVDPLDQELIETPYELRFYVVYDPEVHNSQKTAEDIVKGILDLKTQGKINSEGIDLIEVETYSDNEFTLADLKRTLNYRLDYISNNTDTELYKS